MPSPAPTPVPSCVPMSHVLAGLSYALDLTEGARPGHAVRSCLIGMRIADAIGLPREDRASLFYALVLKDLGCSSNSARFAALFGAHDQDLKTGIKTIDWTKAIESFRYVAANTAPGQFWLRRVWRLLAILSHGPEGPREVVRTRCERGADLSRMLGLSDDTSNAIRALDEHWDGHGQPYGTKGTGIPLLGRVLCLAQTMEVYCTTYGALTAFDMAAARRGTWFDPALTDALFSIRSDSAFWLGLGRDDLGALARVAPEERLLPTSEEQLDVVAEAFARVIDAKSPWTYRHSTGVGGTAVAMGQLLGYAPQALRELRRSALLHDLGKLGVSNLILDKPGALTATEMAIMRRHPEYTARILERVSCFAPLAASAAAHHERLDGRGYHRGISAPAISHQARILCVADICDALKASRPYRAGLPPDRVLAIMQPEVGHALDAECFAALRETLQRGSFMDEPDQVPAVRVVSALADDYTQAA